MLIRILSIMGTKLDRALFEVVVVNPEGEDPTEYVDAGDVIEESQMVEFVGNWTVMPSSLRSGSETMSERIPHLEHVNGMRRL